MLTVFFRHIDSVKVNLKLKFICMHIPENYYFVFDVLTIINLFFYFILVTP